MSSINQMFEVLHLFSEKNPVWTIDEATEHLHQSRSTVYRYFRALIKAEMLVPVSRGGYALGPFIIKLDRQIRQTDPLLVVAPPVVTRLHQETGQVVMLGRMFQNDLLCIHEEGDSKSMEVTFARGRASSLFHGATPRVILANLPLRQIKDLYLARTKEIENAGLGASWDDFIANLKKIRKQGVYVSAAGEVDKEVVGIAAPIFDADNQVVAGLTIAAPESACTEATLAEFQGLVKAAAHEISTALADFNGS